MDYALILRVISSVRARSLGALRQPRDDNTLPLWSLAFGAYPDSCAFFSAAT